MSNAEEQWPHHCMRMQRIREAYKHGLDQYEEEDE